MSEKELMDHLKAGILKREVETQERAAREEEERLEVAKANEKWDRIKRRNHQEALHLEPLVEQMLREWPNRAYASYLLNETIVFCFSIAKERLYRDDISLAYSISLALVEMEEPSPLLKLKQAIDHADYLWQNRHEEPKVDAKALLEECEEELEDDTPFWTPLFSLIGIVALGLYFKGYI